MTASAAQRTIRFTVEGMPLPAVRMTRRGVQTPTHPKRRQLDAYLAYKESVGWAARAVGATPLGGPLYLRLWVYTSRRGRQRGDWDNLSKAICDGMTGVCFQDDSQIEDARVQLRHVPVGSESVDVEVGVIG